jgi:hypothetical protein
MIDCGGVISRIEMAPSKKTRRARSTSKPFAELPELKKAQSTKALNTLFENGSP